MDNIEKKEELKKESIGWFFLAFLFPVVGLILFFIFKNNNLHRGKRLLVGTVSGILASAVSFIVSLALLFSLFNNNTYSLSIESSSELYTYKETYNILFLNKKADKGTFVSENIIVRNYFDGYNDIYEGDVRVIETTTEIGTWTIDENGYYLLLIEKTFLELDFSGKGKDDYIERVRNSYINLYGFDTADKLLDEKRVELKTIKGMKKLVSLNEEDNSIIEYRTTFK
jgi:hypothetical protein